MQSTNADHSSRDVPAPTVEPSSSATPLLNANASVGSQTSANATMSAPSRRSITRAQTIAGEATTSAKAGPLLTNPTQTSTSLPTLESATTAKPATRPSLFKRITTQIDSALDLSGSAAADNIPPSPSHWTDFAHRAALLQTWDDIHEAAASSKSKYPRSITGQLVAVEKSLLLQFPELGEGAVTLRRDWMEYVLGLGMRHPFCSEGKAMGRWEILSSAGRLGGSRAWGPW
jgi:hypothetical protein